DHGPPRTVPDGTVIRPGEAGTGATAYVGKEGGAHFVGDVWGAYADRKFDNNDVGFNQRGNVLWDGFDLEYRTLEPSGPLLETHTRLEVWDSESIGGLNLRRGADVNTSGKLASFWRYYAELHLLPTRYDDREFGDGAALERATFAGADVRVQSDPTKALVG